MASTRAHDSAEVPLANVVDVSAAVAAESRRSAKVALLAAFLAAVPEDQVAIAVGVLSGSLPTPLGLGPARLRDAWLEASTQTSLLTGPALTLRDLDTALREIAGSQGSGSTARKIALLRTLLERATPAERGFVLRLCLGELRQGAQEGVMIDAVAAAFGESAEAVRRAHMLSGDLPRTAELAVMARGEGLAAVELSILRPVEPMLASTASGLAEALARHGRTILEWKLDGARIQAHKAGGEVRVFSRTLRDVTDLVPEVVALVSALGAESVVLDGEMIALRADGRPHPFQTTMSRFASTPGGERDRGPPLTPFFFDILHLEGEGLVERPQRERSERLRALLRSSLVLPTLETDSPEAAEAFMRQALAAGHEGVMAKDPAARYEAGRRGKAWIKVKPARTLDLVVLAVERGSGRRSGWWSNIHLGARDEAGGFAMLGKTFKGMSDEVLRWQTETFPALATHVEGHVMYLRPVVVAEIAFNQIQRSRRYPAGLALRFARLERYRPDKLPEQADTIATVREWFTAETGEDPP